MLICVFFPSGQWTWTSLQTCGWPPSTKQLSVTRLAMTSPRKTLLFSEWIKIFDKPKRGQNGWQHSSREFEHPRFGCIMSVVALRDIEPKEEVLTIITIIIVTKETIFHRYHWCNFFFRCLSVTITASAVHLHGDLKALFIKINTKLFLHLRYQDLWWQHCKQQVGIES